MDKSRQTKGLARATVMDQLRTVRQYELGQRSLLLGLVVCTYVSCAAHEVSVEPTPVCPESMARVDGGRLGAHDIAEFCLDLTEVTTAAYASCVRDGGCPPVPRRSPAAQPPVCNAYISGRGEHPSNCLDAAQAAAFCSWAGKRVPTDSEWMWAAQGRGRATTYPWGHAPVDDVRACLGSTTCGVGERPAGSSPDGIVDLVGNVGEWTRPGGFGALELRGGSFRGATNTNSDLSAHAPPLNPVPDLTIAGVRCAVQTHTAVRTIDTQGWQPDAQAVAPKQVLPDVATPPPTQVAQRPLSHLAPLSLRLATESKKPPTMWPFGQTYIEIDAAKAGTLGFQHSVEIGKLPPALADFEPIHPAGPLVLMHAGWRRSGYFVAFDRDTAAIRWQANFESLGRSYDRVVTPKALVASLYGMDVDVVVGLALVDGRELFKKTGSKAGEFSRVRKLWDDGDRVYLAGDRGVLAFDATSGQTLWGPVAVGTSCGVAVGDGFVVVEDPAKGHRVLDAATGLQRRRLPAQPSVGTCKWGGDAWDGGVADAVVEAGKLYAFDPPVEGKRGPILRATDLQTGSQQWARTGLLGQLLVVDQDAVLSDRAGAVLVALDSGNGTPQAEISLGYSPTQVEVAAGGGKAGPLVRVRDEQDNEWILGRVENQPQPEAYSVRGRLVPDPDTGVRRRHVARVPIRVKTKRVRSDKGGKFVARGQAIGAVLVSYDGPTSYEDFKGDPYSRTLTRFDPKLVVLSGAGTYKLGEIVLYEWWLE